MSNQGGVQQAIRNQTGTALDYNGDWSALFDQDGIASGDWNGRLLAWINATLGTSYTEINGAKQAFAVDQGFNNWSSMNTVVLWTPLALSPDGWWDVSNIGTLWQDTAGTVPVTADGDTVKRVDDLSGNGKHWIQGTTSQAPIYRANSGLPYLEFDGVDDHLYVDDPAAFNFGASDFAIWLAMRRDSAAGYRLAFAKTDNATGDNWRSFITSSLTLSLFRGTDAQSSSFSTLETVVGQDHVAMWGRDDTQDQYELDGTTEARAWSAAGVGSTSQNPILFAGPALSYPMAGRFYGGLVRDAYLDTDEAALLRTWLGAKAGLTL